MDAGTVPPQWEDLLKHSSKKATNEEFSLAEDWIDTIKTMPDQSSVTAGSRSTDPFAVVTEGNNPANATRAATASQDQPPDAQFPHQPQASEGENVCTLASSLSALGTAASLAQKRQQLLSHDDAAVNNRNEFDSPVDRDTRAENQLTMPQHMNMHKAGLRQSLK